MDENKIFDITVIGAGHAGLEASWIASQFDLAVCLISLPEVEFGTMACNPAVGGVGKGQLVREIDSMGGLIGVLADKAAIQYRTLNESKGYAVRSTRAQIDKKLYSEYAHQFISESCSINPVRGGVSKIEKIDDLFHVELLGQSKIISNKVIVTAGTFLSGILHTGNYKRPGGMLGKPASLGLKSICSQIRPLGSKFKTGTPPRLKKDTINFDKLIEQKSDPKTINFHWKNFKKGRFQQQVSCFLTRSNQLTLDIIRENRERSPLFNGQIAGVGPRYCPSIEDKAFRYPDRNGHHIFLEPEGLSLDTVYPNGLSTSLPEDVQRGYINTIHGLEKAVIADYGYAVEYDVVDTTNLDLTLEHLDLPGLYFAGQINGTSGYEEAAGQGLVAGINAALSVKKREKLIFSRSDSYLGVLIEDIVSNKRDEPYRLFTARAENRLFIREDNVLIRMYNYRKELNLSLEIDKYQRDFIREVALLTKLCTNTTYSETEKSKKYFQKAKYGNIDLPISLKNLICRSDLDSIEVLKDETVRFGADFMDEAIQACAISFKYEGYIKRADEVNKKMKTVGAKELNWGEIENSKHISVECLQRIKAIRPKSFSQLQKIEGIRPATLLYVASNCLL